ncbi:MAG: hypothetical protein JRI68_14670 [Deltaproteobacteria bacterium]|nr:hypothetical protein [Deltaproteobacteria bacterium]
MTSPTTELVRALCAGAVVATVGWSSPALADCICPAESVIGCGHRGTGQSGPGDPFPENTLPSIQQAANEGADMVEIDVVHSADGVLVVIHDDRVDRTTDGSGCVGHLTLAELQALDAAEGTALAGQGVTIPTLAEVLAAVDVAINVELKMNGVPSCPDADKPAMAADVVSAIQGDSADRDIVVSSFDADVLTEVEQLDPTIHTGLITLNPSDAQLAQERGFDALNPRAGAGDETVVQDVHGLGLALNVWTENDPERMKALIGFGVDMIITDEPDVFATVRVETCEQLTCPDASSAEDSGGCAVRDAPHHAPRGPWWLVLGGLWLGLGRRSRS